MSIVRRSVVNDRLIIFEYRLRSVLYLISAPPLGISFVQLCISNGAERQVDEWWTKIRTNQALVKKPSCLEAKTQRQD